MYQIVNNYWSPGFDSLHNLIIFVVPFGENAKCCIFFMPHVGGIKKMVTFAVPKKT
jgi:hypothetical protein